MNSPVIPLLVVLTSLPFASLFADVLETDLNSTSAATYDGDVSATDLINLGQSSLLDWTSSIGPVGNVGTQISGIFNGTANNGGDGNDGLADGSLTYLGSRETFGGTAVLNSNPVLTFYFNLDNGSGGSSTGYTLTSIQSIFGWRDFGSMSDQLYTISISTDPAQTSFSNFYTVNYHPFNPSSDLSNGQPNSSKVVLSDLGLSGVTAISFTFSPYNNGTTNQAGQLIREIDVFGTPTVVPEPSSVALVTVGGFAVFLTFRRRRQAV